MLLQNLSNSASQVGDERPISFCQFSPDSQQLATCSWLVRIVFSSLAAHVISYQEWFVQAVVSALLQPHSGAAQS